MGWWKDANEAEDPDRLRDDVKQVRAGLRTLGKAIAGEVRGDRRHGGRADDKRDRRR